MLQGEVRARPGACRPSGRRPGGWLLALACLLASACAQRPGPDVLTPYGMTSDQAVIVRVFAATTREANPAPEPGYSDRFAYETAYRWYDISVPNDRGDGEIIYPRRRPDPDRDYLVVRSGALDRTSFFAEVERQNAAQTAETGVFVHGFNTRFQEGLFLLAQITADSGGQGAPVLFSWPSAGHALDYVADRDAALFSRDALSELLTGLAPSEGRLLVFGHSLGGWLTLESLRTLRLTGRGDVLDDLDIVLASPDIDVQVFTLQIRTIGPLNSPIVLLVSPDDRVLALSAMVAGGRPRLGAMAVDDPTIAETAIINNLQIVDISSVDGDALGHRRFVHLARLFSELADERRERSGLRRAGAFVLDTLDRELIRPVTGGPSPSRP